MRLVAAAAALLAASPALPASAQTAAAPPSACAPAPRLELGPRFADPGGAFAPSTAAFRATVANFEAAYRRACREGLLHGIRLFGPIPVRDRVLLINAPDSNQAGLYPDEPEPAPVRHLWLEYYFVGHDGAANVPDADELHEAIYCHVQGATPQEQEEEGRCLPD